MSDGNSSGYLLKQAAATPAVAVVAALGLMVVVLVNHVHAIAGKPVRWLLNGPGAAAIAADADASRLLDNTRPFVMMGARVGAVPPSWNAITFASFTGVGAIKNALESGKISPDAKGVMYDYEKWQFTPEDEQRDSAGYVKQAADLVHARGLQFLAAPAVNLIAAIAPQDRGPRYAAYLRLGIAADAARYADVFDIQAQGSERNTELYSNFVRQAAAQARQANPKVIVLAGISTQPNGQDVTADDILRAITATHDAVDGYWFNIPRPSEYCPRCTAFRPDIAIEVLRRLAGQ
jgi:hypothetical protein